ncbi:unnamed protein product [Closterium sp. NIES-65]|nr:unnamed protein product [Closterium sp. NIES-65]
MASTPRIFFLVAVIIPLLLLLSSLPSAEPARERAGGRGGGRGAGRTGLRPDPRSRRGNARVSASRSISPAASRRSASASSATLSASASSASASAAASAEKPAGCSCYTVRNSFCCWQSLCVCHNVCYNGSALVGDFGSQPCIRAPLPEAAENGAGNETAREKRRRQRLLQEENPLVPVTCRRLDKFRRILRITLKEAPIDGIGQRDKGWRKERERIEWRAGTTWRKERERIEWRAGMTYLQPFLLSSPLFLPPHSLRTSLVRLPSPTPPSSLPNRWRKGRDSIEWRKGMTYLQPFVLALPSSFPLCQVAQGERAHRFPLAALASTILARSFPFLLPPGKVGQLLLINNASKLALPHPVDHFMFPRAPQLLQAVQAAGKDSWHVVVLRQLLGLAVAPMLGETALKKASMAARRFIGTEPLAGGLVEFEPAFEAASETRPLCFGKVVIPGKLKAITYPGGPSEAEMFKAHLGSSLGLPNPPLPLGDSPSARAKPRVQLLFIRRNRTNVGGRRILDDGSDGALYDLFYDMGFKIRRADFTRLSFRQQYEAVLNAEIRRADFTRLSFRQQYEAVLNAEVIVGVHGAGLTSAAAFARNRSVVLEIMPHNTFNPRYYFMAVQAGVSYFLHQLRPGAKQPLDEEFETLTVRKCSSVPDCRKYFYEDRLVNVTKEDLEDLKVLLGEARTFVRQARWNLNWAGKRLRMRYETLCSAGKARDIGCRMDLIRSPVADVKTECLMKMDCLTVKPMLADDLDDIM